MLYFFKLYLNVHVSYFLHCSYKQKQKTKKSIIGCESKLSLLSPVVTLCCDRLQSSAGQTYRLATTQELVSLVIKCRWTLLASNEDSPHVTECSIFSFPLKKKKQNVKFFFSLFAYYFFFNAHINHTYKELWKDNQVYKRSSTCIHNIAKNVFLRGQCKAQPAEG